MKKIVFILAALACVAWGCSDDNNEEEKHYGFAIGSDERPDWQAPNFDNFAQSMVVRLNLQDTLKNYVSSQDLLCAKIQDEVRGVTVPEYLNGRWTFSLSIAGNGGDGIIDLSYYCENLKTIFVVENWSLFDNLVAPIGDSEFYTPQFVK